MAATASVLAHCHQRELPRAFVRMVPGRTVSIDAPDLGHDTWKLLPQKAGKKWHVLSKVCFKFRRGLPPKSISHLIGFLKIGF